MPGTGSGYAVFLGNQEKAFGIYVDQSVGAAIAMFMQGTQKDRPLTHDLLANILRALGAKIEKAIVNDLRGCLKSPDSVIFHRLRSPFRLPNS